MKGRRVDRKGYAWLYQPDHPRALSTGYVAEHIVVAERVFGGPLPQGAEVHHANGVKDDNRPENLVVCPDRAYHKLLHVRKRALDACGHADWRRCYVCGEWDAPENVRLKPGSKGATGIHRACNAEMARTRWAKKEQAA